ncbi:hypothetical protein Ccrd_003028 [Cynara cardunculus var. scolymus]|uniref:Uncharacterized protein n=1 Tax=Cynara cardunculus var. scolymus TaxID=59895 RepID=A0A103XQ82_CYNCS|nr:hypothetical protein Ccrd_003028 [Cynara cardunculus var. scolymus]
MISLKAIQTCFITTKHEIFHKTDFSTKNHHHSRLFLCKSKDSDTNSPSSSPPPSEGDERKQDLLARIAMLQAQKVRLTDYLDERSAYLTQFAEEANVEFDQIMGNIESQMQAFEESAESSKMEIEENQKKLDEFENRFANERNEGLFFQSLGESKPVDKSIAKAAAQKMNELNKQTAGTETRRNIYLALIGLVSISIVESLISPSFDWRKGVVLGLILVGLLTQLTYEQKMLSETQSTESEKNQKKKE